MTSSVHRASPGLRLLGGAAFGATVGTVIWIFGFIASVLVVTLALMMIHLRASTVALTTLAGVCSGLLFGLVARNPARGRLWAAVWGLLGVTAAFLVDAVLPPAAAPAEINRIWLVTALAFNTLGGLLDAALLMRQERRLAHQLEGLTDGDDEVFELRFRACAGEDLADLEARRRRLRAQRLAIDLGVGLAATVILAFQGCTRRTLFQHHYTEVHPLVVALVGVGALGCLAWSRRRFVEESGFGPTYRRRLLEAVLQAMRCPPVALEETAEAFGQPLRGALEVGRVRLYDAPSALIARGLPRAPPDPEAGRWLREARARAETRDGELWIRVPLDLGPSLWRPAADLYRARLAWVTLRSMLAAFQSADDAPQASPTPRSGSAVPTP
jgi:hypothetical protein